MLLKTKERCGKLGNEPGMFVKTKVVSRSIRECYRKQMELVLVRESWKSEQRTICPSDRIAARQRSLRCSRLEPRIYSLPPHCAKARIGLPLSSLRPIMD